MPHYWTTPTAHVTTIDVFVCPSNITNRCRCRSDPLTCAYITVGWSSINVVMLVRPTRGGEGQAIDRPGLDIAPQDGTSLTDGHIQEVNKWWQGTLL